MIQIKINHSIFGGWEWGWWGCVVCVWWSQCGWFVVIEGKHLVSMGGRGVIHVEDIKYLQVFLLNSSIVQ